MFNPFLIPPPVEVIRTAIPMMMSGEIFGDVAISMVRVWSGSRPARSPAVITGVLLGRIRILHDLLDPIIELLRYLSPTAMIPIAVIWFGIGETFEILPDLLGHVLHRASSTHCRRMAHADRHDSAPPSASAPISCRSSCWSSSRRRSPTS